MSGQNRAICVRACGERTYGSDRAAEIVRTLTKSRGCGGNRKGRQERKGRRDTGPAANGNGRWQMTGDKGQAEADVTQGPTCSGRREKPVCCCRNPPESPPRRRQPSISFVSPEPTGTPSRRSTRHQRLGVGFGIRGRALLEGSPSSQRKGQNRRSNRSALLLTRWSASCGSHAIGNSTDSGLPNPLGGARGAGTGTGKRAAGSGLQPSRDVSPSRTAYFVSSATLCRSRLLMIFWRWVSMVLALTCSRAAICLVPWPSDSS